MPLTLLLRRKTTGYRIFRRYFLAIAGVATLLVLLGGSLEVWGWYQREVGQFRLIQHGQVRLVATEIDQRIAQALSTLTPLAELPWTSKAFPRQDQQYELKRALKAAPALRDVAIVSRSGQELLYVSRIQPDAWGGQRSTPHAAIDGDDGHWHFDKPFYVDSSAPVVHVSLRHRYLQELLIVGLLDLRSVAPTVRDARNGRSGIAFLAALDGAVLAHPDPAIALSRSAIAQPALLEQLRAAGVDEVRSWQGATFGPSAKFVSLLRLKSADWVAAVEQDVDELYAPLRRILFVAGLGFAAALLLALAASRMIAHRLAAPIQEMEAATDALRHGRLDVRVKPAAGTELETLATSINDMAAQLQHYTEHLEQRVAEKTRDLEIANRHKSEFLTHMSHELRTPLNAVIGFARALDQQLFGPLTPKQAEYVQDIHESGLHLLSLINDILDLSKVEAGRMDLEPAEFDLRCALGNVVTLLSERAQRAQVVLELRADAAPATWRADPRKFKQILINLVANAVKFTPVGGRVTIAARLAQEQPGCLQISVLDTGPGIPAEERDRVFEDFVRGRNSSDQEGTGLGLPLARKLARLHGGDVVLVPPAPGDGACFMLTLPCHP